MAIDLTIPFLMVLAFDFVVTWIAAVVGYCVLRRVVRSVRALKVSRQIERLAYAGAGSI